MKVQAKRNHIISGNESIRYHWNCRSTYTTKLHLKCISSKLMSSEQPTTSKGSYVPVTRSRISTDLYDWEKGCFVCEAECNPKKHSFESMVQSGIGQKGLQI